MYLWHCYLCPFKYDATRRRRHAGALHVTYRRVEDKKDAMGTYRTQVLLCYQFPEDL
jgi:hypothetical protein